MGGARSDIGSQCPKIFDFVPSLLGEPNSMLVTVPKGKLQVRKKASSTGDGEDHTAKFTKQAVPYFQGYTRAAPDFGKNFE
jgi:hypothetical protein